MNRNWFSFCTKFLNLHTLFGAVVFIPSISVFIDVSMTLNRSSFLSFSRNCGLATGQIMSIKETRYGEGGEITRYPIFQVEYTYRVDSAQYTSFGYATTLTQNVGDDIPVRYKLEDPTLSKAGYLRTSHYGSFVLVVILLPVAGVWIVISGIKWGRRFLSLLNEGSITTGQHLSTCAEGENFKHYYQFLDQNGRLHRVSTVTARKIALENVKVLFSNTTPENAEVVCIKTTPILFGRSKIMNLLNGSQQGI